MNGELRQEMLVAFCLAKGGEAAQLFRFAAPEEEESLERMARRIGKESADLVALKSRMQNRIRFGRRLGLEDLHPGWILEALRGESPRLLKLITEQLSADKSEYIFSHLSFEERQRLPHSARPVAAQVIEILLHLLGEKLGLVPLKADGSFSFSHLIHLKGEEFRTLIRDLGIEEIRRAFSGVENELLKAFLARFPLVDAAEIHRRLKGGGELTLAERRKAQRHILSLNFDQLPSEKVFLEIGFSLFSQALQGNEFAWAERLCQKLPLVEGYHFKRYLQDRDPGETFRNSSPKDEILKRVIALAQEGKIHRYWKDEKEVEPTVILKEAL